MNKHRKALSITLAGVMVALVAWLGATHTNAQDTSARSPVLPEGAGDLLAQADHATQHAQQAVVATGVAAEPVAAETEVPPEQAQDPPPEPTVAEIQADGDVITHWPLQEAPIRLVLRQLAMWGQKNIVASRNVSGTVTTDLFNVTFREALNALLRANELVGVEEGNFIFVYTAQEYAEIEAAQRTTETRVFRLSHLKPADAEALIAPLLSPAGRVAGSPEAASGIAPSSVAAGGMDYAAPDMLVVADYPEHLEAIAQMLREADARPVQVLIEATVMVAKLDESNSLGIDFGSIGGIDMGDLRLNFGGLPLVDGEFVFPQGRGNIAVTGTDGGMLVQAIEQVADLNVLANPKLLVLNKQRGEVIVGRQIAYQDQITRDDSGQTTSSISFLDTGTRLIVRPFVGDHGYIRMEVHPELSDFELRELGDRVAPDKQTTECTSNVMVRDGHTIIISGMFRDKTTQGRSQVPVLGNIPALGAAFRRTNDAVEREEVIILLTPRIVRQSNAEAVSMQLQDDMNRFRAGMRQNLMWFGRSRLAVRHLNWAKEHMATGNNRRAMWDINMALSLSPAMDEAIEFKEYLTGKALWADEARSSSARWAVQRMIMTEMGLNVNMIAEPYRPANAADLPAEVTEAMGIGADHKEPIMPEPRRAVEADEPAAEAPIEWTDETAQEIPYEDDELGAADEPCADALDTEPEAAVAASQD